MLLMFVCQVCLSFGAQLDWRFIVKHESIDQSIVST